MFEHAVDVVAFACRFPDRRTEFARRLEPFAVFRRADLGHLAPAVELLAVDDAFGAELPHEIGLIVFGDDADGISPRRCAKLNCHGAEAPRRAPHEHVVARTQHVRTMTEQHAVGGRENERVTGALFPGQMLGALEKLTVLHAGELSERAVRRFIAPDSLRGREHRVAAVALFVVAVVLVTMDDDFVADFPALDLGPDLPDDAGRIRSGDVIGLLVAVERRDRRAKTSPDPVVIDASGHHEHEHVVAIEFPSWHDLDLHRGVRRPMAFAADDPGIHVLGHVTERRNLADFVKIFLAHTRDKFLRRHASGGNGWGAGTFLRHSGYSSRRRTQFIGVANIL